MQINRWIAALFMLCFSVSSYAANSGVIQEISFASNVAETVRPGTAQFSIEGGFSEFGDCNKTYAAIDHADHYLISLLLTAKTKNMAVEVHLDKNRKYFADRCLVAYLEIQ